MAKKTVKAIDGEYEVSVPKIKSPTDEQKRLIAVYERYAQEYPEKWEAEKSDLLKALEL